MDIYGHLLFGMQAEAARLMDELISPIPVNLDEFSNEKAALEGID